MLQIQIHRRARGDLGVRGTLRRRRLGLSAALGATLAVLAAPVASAAVPANIDFGPAGRTPPAGYAADTGQAYATARGFGWVRQDSLSASAHVGLDITTRMRKRTVVTDRRLDTVALTQSAPGGPSVPGAAWEFAVPTGLYRVKVAVGDASAFDSVHRVRVEGSVAIAGFAPSATTRFSSATVTVRVTDGRLTIDTSDGTNTKLAYVDIASGDPVDDPPAAPTAFAATAGDNSVTLSWAPNREADLAGYRIYRSTTTPVLTTGTPLGGQVTGTRFFDPNTGNGTTYYYTLVAVDRAGHVSATAPEVAATPDAVPVPGAGRLQVENLDPAPFADRLIFNRIGSLTSPPENGVHDRGTARVTNTSDAPLSVLALVTRGPFALLSPPSLPATIAPGASLDLRVRFTATSGRVSTGSLTIQSSDPAAPNTVVQLAGYYQPISEGGREPTLPEIASVMGYGTRLAATSAALNRAGRIETIGDEVLASYWQRLDEAGPVGITQLASFHTQGNPATVLTFPRGTRTARSIMASAGIDGQSFLPHRSGSATALASTTFVPTTAQFGFRIDSEWSDPLLNQWAPDRESGCVTGCGHHIRFWPVKDRDGRVVPGSYLMAMDYAGINYDYQDNVYLITNVTPVAQPAMPRVDVGSTVGYTDSLGRFWAPDAGLFAPFNTPPEPGSPAASPVTGTPDSRLYQTYRAYLPDLEVPDRYLNFRIPEPGMTTANVTLHFAERFWSGPRQRLFDIFVEGRKVASEYDIYAESGGKNRALQLVLPDVPIGNGSLDLTLKALADYGAVNAIEVTCASGCTG